MLDPFAALYGDSTCAAGNSVGSRMDGCDIPKELFQAILQMRLGNGCEYKHGKFIPAHASDASQVIKGIPKLAGNGTKDAIPFRVAVFVIQLLEEIHVDHHKIAPFSIRTPVGLQRFQTHMKKCFSRHQACQSIHPCFVFQICCIAAVDDKEDGHQRHQGKDADHKLNLQMHQIAVINGG